MRRLALTLQGKWTATLRIHVSGAVPKKLELALSDAARAARAVTRTAPIR
jgi:hypothetical protein